MLSLSVNNKIKKNNETENNLKKNKNNKNSKKYL